VLKIAGLAAAAVTCAAGIAVFAHANGNAGAPPRATLIQTKLVFSDRGARGTVLRGSWLGEERFCVNGRFRDSPVHVGVRKRFRCPGQGRLTLEFRPHGRGRTQSGTWTLVSGTGDFADINTGRGWMAVRHGRNSSREFFTGRMR
jgi:hypothetical protein